uniref:Nonstructural polyprotein n=1 Tax=Picornavirales sp. TaxID=1955153 RepID=A0A646R2C0_9VIRU|nr:nonstructural polyprotein [Picornavirales sp.]
MNLMNSKLFYAPGSRRTTTFTTPIFRVARASSHLISALKEVCLLQTPIDTSHVDETTLIVQRLTIAALQLQSNFTIKGVVLFIISAASELKLTVFDLLERLRGICSEVPQLATKLIQQIGTLIASYTSSVPSEGIEFTSLPDDLFSGLDKPETVANLTSMVAALAAMVAASLVGAVNYKPTKPMLSNLAAYGSEISKLNNGAKALLELVGNFSRLVHDQVLAYFGSTPANAVVAAIESLQIKNSDDEIITSHEFFTDLVYYLSDEGERAMSIRKKDIDKARFCSKIINLLITETIQNKFKIPSYALTQMQSMQRILDTRVRLSTSKTLAKTRRRTPFCIWLSGPPGVGKSQAMAKLARDLYANLAQKAAYYEIPPEEQAHFACSFGQEFKTGYNSHYIFSVDDMCQDKAGSTRTSSTMDFIQWVSCIPVNVNQAALEDKSCPFTSNIFLCSSNSSYPNRSAEIMDNGALRRRRHMLIECELPESEKAKARADPKYVWEAKYTLRDSIDQVQAPIKVFDSYNELLVTILKRYKEHFDHENDLIKYAECPTMIDPSEFGFDRETPLNEQHDEMNDNDDNDFVNCELAGADAERVLDNTPRLESCLESISEDSDSAISSEGELVIVRSIYGEILVPDHIVYGEVSGNSQLEEDLSIVRALYDAVDYNLPEYWLRYLNEVGEYVWCPKYDPNAEMSLPHEVVLRMIEEHADKIDVFEDILTYSYSYIRNCLDDERAPLEPTMDDNVSGFLSECLGTTEESWLSMLSKKIGWKSAQRSWFKRPARVSQANLEEVADMHNFAEDCLSSSVEHQTWMSRIKEKMGWKAVIAISSVASTVFAVYWLKNKFWRSYYDMEITYDKNIIRTKPKPVVKPPPLDPVMQSFVGSILEKNSVVVTVNGTGRANGIFVKGRYFMTCRHVMLSLVDGDMFSVTKGTVKYDQVFDQRRLKTMPGCNDVVLYKCDESLPMSKDITSKFPDSNTHIPTTFDATIAALVPEAMNYTMRFCAKTERRELNLHDDTVVYFVNYYQGYGCNGKGNSGSPLIVHEGVGRAPMILGLQFARSVEEHSVFVEPISREALNQALIALEPCMAWQEPVDVDEMYYDCSDNMEAFINAVKCTVDFMGKEQPVLLPIKTKLRPSEIASSFPMDPQLKVYAPAALSGKSNGVAPENAKVDPLLLSMQGFGLPYGGFDCRIGSEVLSQFIAEDRIVRQCPNNKISMRLLTDDEILNGIPGYLKGVELSTSPGLPYLRKKRSAGKKDWITMDENGIRSMVDSVWDDVARLEELAMDPMEDSGLLSYACLKDELRPIERVAQCKTRTFIVLPMHYNLLLRKYFGTWVAVQHELAAEIASCVGIDANSQWWKVYDKINNAGPDVEDFDYTDWDRTIHAQWFNIYADRVSAAYGDKPGSKGWIIRRSLMTYLVHMKILVRDVVIQTHGGNKSGCAITAEINSDVHDMLMYYVWFKLAKERNAFNDMSLQAFREKCSIVVYGDDIIKATNPSTTAWFNGENIRRIVQQLGMNITPATKTDTEFKVKRISEVTFLKRSFLKLDKDCGLVRAPLDKSVIQRMVLWTHKNDDNAVATAANIEGACRESFYWGEQFYNEFKDKCVTAWSAKFKGAGYPVSLNLPSYEVMENAYRARNFCWSPTVYK